MTFKEIRERKKELGLTNEMIADKAGIPLSTVQKFFSGHTKSPRYDTIMAIEKILEEPQEMREPVSSYHCYGSGHTIDDYYDLPEGAKAELIDGRFYDLASPTVAHQDMVLDLAFQLRSYIDAKKGQCRVFIAPLDVKLGEDDRTMLQPDVMIVCDPQKIKDGKRIEGAPDFVAEILSESTFRKDLILKYRKYKSAGVREYWMIDIESRTVYTCDLTKEKAVMEIHELSEKIALAISGGECEVDFSGHMSKYS